MKLLAKFNLILLVIFSAGGSLIALLAHDFLISSARREVLDEAQLMLASTQSIRDYTSKDLSPLLTQVPQHRVRFLAETVPAFGATTAFHSLRKNYPDYSYKEATLNPTNLEDRASDWESDVIHSLRDHPGVSQTEGERETPSGRSLYLANPIVAGASCLECHSVPSAAPKAMLTVYGSANGFGWKQNEIVGAQIISRADVGSHCTRQRSLSPFAAVSRPDLSRGYGRFGRGRVLVCDTASEAGLSDRRPGQPRRKGGSATRRRGQR